MDSRKAILPLSTPLATLGCLLLSGRRPFSPDLLHQVWWKRSGLLLELREQGGEAIALRLVTERAVYVSCVTLFHEEEPMGHPLTLNVPERVYQSLVRKAEESGQPLEALAVQLLTTATQPGPDDPLEAFIGAFDSQGSDWVDHHDSHLGSFMRDTMRG
jgi:hypothetical protein